MTKKIIRLTESDLIKLVNKFLKEDMETEPEMVNVPLDKVTAVQQALKDKSEVYAKLLGTTGPNGDGVDGKFGKNTRNAVKSYQKDNGIKQTGNVGPITSKSLGVEQITKNSKVSQSPKPEEPTKNSKVSQSPKPEEPTKNSNSYILFDGSYLSFIDNGKVIKKWKAYSGRTKWNTFGDKNAEKYVNTVGQDPQQFMKIGQAGPIPSGQYSISQIQERTKGNAYDLCNGKNYKELLALMMKSSSHDWNTGTTGDLIAWGDYRCPISAVKGTNTYGRGSFYIHGGGIAGSIGCIDLLLNIKDFVDTFQSWKDRTKNNSIKLIVKY